MKNSLKLASVLLLGMASQGASAYNWIDCSGTPLFAGDGVQSFGYANSGASGLTAAEITATSQAFVRLSQFSSGLATLGRGVDNSFAGNNGQNEIWQDVGVGTAVCNYWFFVAPTCDVVEVDIRLGAPTWYSLENSNHIPYGNLGRSVQGVQVHEGGHCIGLGHVNNLYSIMGQEWTHVNRNSSTTYYGPGEDTSDALIDLHGERSGGSDTYRDVGVTHWRYSHASGAYSVHKEGRLLNSAGAELPKTGQQWLGQDEYQVIAGASIQTEGTFENNGEKNSENMAVSYRLSTNSIISTGDTELLTHPSYTLIRNSPFYDTQSGLVIPVTTPPGDYWIGIIVDSANTIAETTSANNYTQWPIVIAGPDLTVSAPSVSDTTPTTNQSITGFATINNVGGSQSAATTLRYYRSTNSIISTGDTELDTDVQGIINPGASIVRSEPFVFSATPGTYWYGACVDTVVGETVTNNQCSAGVQVVVSLPPDLTVSAPSVSNTTPTINQTITGFATIDNVGGLPSAATTLRYYRSTNSIISTGDTALGMDAQGVLNAGASIIRSEPFVFSPTPGTYWYGACVDAVPGETVTNNQCSAGVQVVVSLPPDLTVSAPSVSDTTPTTNQSITGFATIDNIGGSPSAATTLRYYRSINSVISIGDTELGSDAQGTINAGASIIRSEPFVFSATPGTYWYGACVDTVPGETVTNNQCSAGVQVVVSLPPDLTVSAMSVSDTTPTTNQSITGFATIENVGGSPSAATTLRYYRSTNSLISTGDTELGSDVQGILNPGFSSSQNELFVFSAIPGTYWYGVCVDVVPGETVTNNQCSAGVQVDVSAIVDTDGDGVQDSLDNCTLVANSDQRDTNGDGYGNICDPDFDNNGIVNFGDISGWVPFFNTPCGDVDQDLNGDGFCNFGDYSIIPTFFQQPPGPSGIAP